MFFKIGKVVLKILQYSQENNCAGVSFVGLKVCNRLQYRCFLWIVQNLRIERKRFFSHTTALVAAFDGPTTVQ